MTVVPYKKRGRFSPFFIISFLAAFSVFMNLPVETVSPEFPLLRVVLDPGHGGLELPSRDRHGDRFDTLSGKYLSDFRAGAAWKGFNESEITWSIASKTAEILKDAGPEGDFRKFEKILRKYGRPVERIYIETCMSRDSGNNIKADDPDPNAAYRLFDYPDSSGQMLPGRISFINSLKPRLVVSIHLAASGSNDYHAINPVIAAPFSFMVKGLDYLRGRRTGRDFFYSSRFRDWFIEVETRTPFSWYLSDVSQYFTGYPLDENRNICTDRFRGYRHNMIQWSYRDRGGWEKKAFSHSRWSPYSADYRDFAPAGKFWDRERSVYEAYRRDGGEEGFGGDNAYASFEIVRYILASLQKNGGYDREFTPGRPYASIWIMPVYINAISAYFELGYLKRKKDRIMMTERQQEIAEGIAAGIYSLLAGIEPDGEDKISYPPKGKKIDLKKYDISSERSYFDEVCR